MTPPILLYLQLLSPSAAMVQDTTKDYCGCAYDSTLQMNVCEFAEVEPEYPGGVGAMLEFIQKNVVYPEISKEMAVQGSVYTEFVVASDGKLIGLQIINKPEEKYTELDKEVLRVIALMPNWIPGLCNGNAVATMFTLPFTFSSDHASRR